MHILTGILVFLHIIGASLIIGLWVAHFRTPKVLPGQFHASLLMLVTGLILVGIAEMSGGVEHSVLPLPRLLASANIKLVSQSLPV